MRADDLAEYLAHEPFREDAPAPKSETPADDIVADALAVFGGTVVEKRQYGEYQDDRRVRQGTFRQGYVLGARPEAEGISALADDVAL